MKLNIKKSTTLNGEVTIEGILAVTLQANISDESAGNTYINQSIIDQDLYSQNRKLCREKISEFQEKVYEIEDRFIEEGVKTAE
ncbi:hypothetical protein [uncultured Vagococcus sp.]|uniref:hypothetical protein n=1 Tax=uncultured Vagococcus sp. TaxID=189676 RepID=UPI0025911DE3|nr:hypothetical protein [uncultured Vagococcus sp.]